MGKKIKGKCKYCGKEYTLGYMKKHLSECKQREAKLAAEDGKRQCGYFELVIHPKYSQDYWLIVEIRETAELADVDAFLRDIWVECCGHLSAFDIYGTRYESVPMDDLIWEEPAKSMHYKLDTVLEEGMTIEYEYDFGSTTELVINVADHRVGDLKKEKITILSRNNPYVIMCSECGEKPAVAVCAECLWDGDGFLCEECSKTHECGEDMLLNVCNSPRMGVCGYCGSEIYPDQFTPDKY